MLKPLLDKIIQRYHYELDKSKDAYQHAISRGESGDLERGEAYGFMRAIKILQQERDQYLGKEAENNIRLPSVDKTLND